MLNHPLSPKRHAASGIAVPSSSATCEHKLTLRSEGQFPFISHRESQLVHCSCRPAFETIMQPDEDVYYDRSMAGTLRGMRCHNLAPSIIFTGESSLLLVWAFCSLLWVSTER